jgi:prolyl 4-hydroxylase
MWLREKSDLSDKIKKLVVEKTNLPLENQEAIHIVKYEIGGQYKLHHDFFHPNTDYYESCIKQGGQRAYSCLIYLNDNFTGGETDFPKVNKTVIPELGKLIVWDNLKEDGSLDYDSFHAGLPVIEGQKWICIVWVRENKFI